MYCQQRIRGLGRRAGLLVGLCVLSGLSRVGAAQTPSAPVYNPANGHWYQSIRVAGGISWPEARAAAEAMSYAGYRGHLVTITSPAENQFIIGAVLNTTDPAMGWWLGAYQDTTAPDYSEPAGGWRWVTGEPWGFTYWSPGEPNNVGAENTIHIGRYDGIWNDRAASYPMPAYLVEYEPVPFPIAASVQLFPQAVIGGTTATGQVSLSSPAGPGGALLSLFSSNPAAAVVPATITIPPAALSVPFPVVTFPVAVPTTLFISASGFGAAGSAALQVLPASPAFPPGNLLINGSFEDPGNFPHGTRALPGWRVTQGTVDLVGWQAAPGQGRQSLDLVGTPGAASIEQSFATDPGRLYTFSGWLSHNPGVSEGRANVFFDGVFFAQLYHSNGLYGTAVDADMRWQPFALTFRATGVTTTLKLTDVTGLWDGGGGAALDGLAVTPTDGAFPPTPPGTPANLTVRLISPTQVDLSWIDTSLDETAFEVQRRSGTGEWIGLAAVAANTTRFSDYGVSPGTTYTYRVRAQRAAGVSVWSNEAGVTTLPP